ncbi:MAG: FtsX-like permease family protein [Tissierellia bacterium]|nr:FtsX-like permease family protein [Tissierellia bacterium]
MKKKALWKDTIREIKRTYPRFLSILLMITLGAFVLVGLTVTGEVMRHSAEVKIKDGNLQDLLVSNAFGLEDKDLDLLSQLEDIEDVELRYSKDFQDSTGRFNLRLFSLPSRISLPLLREGRLPELEDELALDYYLKKEGFQLGDRITFTQKPNKYKPEDEKDDPFLKRYTYKIVGFVETPEQLENIFKGSSIDGTSLNGFAYVLPEVFDMDQPTEARIIFSPTSQWNTGDKEYWDYTNLKEEEAKNLLSNRSKERLEDLRGEIQDELDAGEEEIRDAKAKLEDGEQKLLQGKKDLKKGESDYVKGKRTFASETSKGKSKLAKGKKDLEKARKELDDNKTKLKDGERKLEEGRSKLKESERDFKEGQEKYAEGVSKYQEGKDKLEKEKSKLKEGKDKLDASKIEIEESRKKLAEGERELEKGRRELAEKEPELQKGIQEYEAGLEDYNQGKAELEASQSKLNQGKIEIQEGEAKLKAAEIEIQKGKAAITGLTGQITGINGQIQQLEGVLGTNTDPEEQKKIQGQIQGLQGQKSALENEKNKISQSVTQGEQEYSQGLAKLNAAKAEYEAGLAEYNAGKEKLAQGKEQLDIAKRKIDQGQEELAKGRKKLAAGEAELQSGKSQLLEGEKKYHQGLSDFEDGKKKLKDGEQKLTDSRIELDRRGRELEEGREKLEEGKKDLKTKESELTDAKDKLQEGEEKYQSGQRDLISGQKRLEREIAKGKKDLRIALGKLQDARKDVTEGEKEYEEKKEEAEEEIAKGEKDIKDWSDILEILKQPAYSVEARQNNRSIYQYLDYARRVDLLALFFPIFFFIIAMLISSTTMTRMVDENRIQIGTLKALGYSSWDISKKYLFYGAIASLFGGIIGAIGGNFILTWVIGTAYSTGSIIDELIIGFYWDKILLAIGVGLVCTGIVAWATVGKTLRTNAAELMRPKPPKGGTRIFIERIKPFWNRLDFLRKVTARNIFRYKKRMILTLTGVMGCTALLVLGFGIKTSVAGLVEKQYDELTRFDMVLIHERRLSSNGFKEYSSEIGKDERIKNLAHGRMEMVKMEVPGIIDQTITTLIPDNVKEFEKQVTLRIPRKDEFDLPKDGVVITEKLATITNLKIGDTIVFEDDENIKRSGKISGITEGYAGHYMYLSKDSYEKIFQDKYETNADLIQLKDNNKEMIEEVSAHYQKEKVIVTAITFDYMKDMMEQLVDSISQVVIVILVASTILAFVVLYNLTNINVEERRRELSTIKVLGFYSPEVTEYVYRETWVLTVMGILIGCVMGKILHYNVMKVVVPDNASLYPVLNWLNYFIPSLITIIISIVVRIFIHKKLRAINMVEALKAVE